MAFRKRTLRPLMTDIMPLQATISHLTDGRRCLTQHNVSRLSEVAVDKAVPSRGWSELSLA
jgi:hypothetical protein